MDIKTIIDLNMLQRIQDRFSDATGLAAIAVDAEGNYITKGSNFTDFCMKYTRGCEEGLRRCVKCDTECSGTYYCHAGLMDFASDIVIDGEKAGAIIGGQVLPEPPDYEKFSSIARDLGIDEASYIAALKKVPIRSEKMIRASADMLADIVNQLVNLEYFKKLNAKKIEVYDREIAKALEAIREVRTMTGELERISTMENLLAINASIEASHAGAAGVSFAVVASEIRTLSQNSKGVYDNIFKIINEVKAAIETMGNVQL